MKSLKIVFIIFNLILGGMMIYGGMKKFEKPSPSPTEIVEKVKAGKVVEIIFALSSTMEGDTTNFYIYKQIKDVEIKTSTIARGIAVGDELEYADEVTLGRSILHRVPFENSLNR